MSPEEPLADINYEAVHRLELSSKKSQLQPLRSLTTTWLWLSAIVCTAILLLPLLLLLLLGIRSFAFAETWRVVGQLVLQTVAMTGLGLLIAFPFALCMALWLDDIRSEWLLEMIDRLRSVPSMVIALAGLRLVYRDIGLSWTLFGGAMVLALLAFPSLCIAFFKPMQTITDAERETSYALGANAMQTQIHVVIPRALRGMVAATLRVIAALLGETSALYMICGFGARWDIGLDKPLGTLGLSIYQLASRQELFGSVYGIALTLFIMLLALVWGARRIEGGERFDQSGLHTGQEFIGMV